MGFLDSLRKGLDDLVDEVEKQGKDFKTGFDDFTANTFNSPNQQQYAQPQYAQPQPQYQQSAPQAQDNGYSGFGTKPATDQFAHFDGIIASAFADYEVKRNFSVSELKPDCHPGCKPVQFMFFKDGAPVLAVVLVRANTYRGINVVATKEICEEKGIKYLRFFEEYDNEEAYVVNRIKENL